MQVGEAELDEYRKILAAIRKGDPYKGDVPTRARNGDEFWVSLDITPLTDARGTPTGYVAVASDITELKRSHERALRDLAVAIDQTADGVFLSDRDGRLTYANPALRHLFGLRQDEDITRLSLSDLFPYGWLAPATPPAEGGPSRAWHGSRSGRRRDGSDVKLELSLTHRDEGGVVCIARDITERQRLEQERARMADALQVAQRREVIAHLATGVAHDLNNLIAVVEGTADILDLRPNDESEVRAGAQRIRRATRTARDLVTSLGRLDRAAARRTTHDLRTLVWQAVDLLGSQRLTENTVIVEAADDACPVWGDATDLQQVITNLAVNACGAKADDRANLIRLAVRPESATMPGRAPDVGRVAPEAGYSVVTISDTGTGIAAEHLPKLFERYFSTKGNAGTGLGMPIVATILRENDAALWVDSKAGAGTSVTVAWPSAGPEPLAGAITRRAGPDTAPGLPSGLRILIVDDVPDVAEVLASIVSMAGGNVVSTSDPASALGMIADPTASWSVLVTDLDMPGQTGADLARAAARRDPPLPVLLVTALPERATRDSHLFAGVLSKPVDAGRLIRLVRAVVSG